MSAAAAERVILNARKAGNPAVATAATKVTAATDLMNRLNRIMTGLKADHIQASFCSGQCDSFSITIR